jgi:hypothetical protein
VTVYAYYNDEYDHLIDGFCNAELREGGVKVKDIYMESFFGFQYYKGTVILPEKVEDYTIRATCSSSDHGTRSSSVSFTPRKKQAFLVIVPTGTVSYGQVIEVIADYNHLGLPISGSCTVSFSGETKEMAFSGTIYSGSITIPYVGGSHSFEVKCTSGRYEDKEDIAMMTPVERSTTVEVVSPTNTVFYPIDTIAISISYEDSLTGRRVSDASCFLNDFQMTRTEGDYHVAEVSNLTVGSRSFSFRCFKQFFNERKKTLSVTVIKIPIEIEFIDTREEYGSREDIEIKAGIESVTGNNTNVSCKARVDSYEPLFNKFLDYKIMDMVQKGGMHVLTIKNPGKSVKMVVTVTCSGDVHEEKTARIEVRTDQLSRETEETAILVLSVSSVILVALVFLIRKKLKIL